MLYVLFSEPLQAYLLDVTNYYKTAVIRNDPRLHFPHLNDKEHLEVFICHGKRWLALVVPACISVTMSEANQVFMFKHQ